MTSKTTSRRKHAERKSVYPAIWRCVLHFGRRLPYSETAARIAAIYVMLCFGFASSLSYSAETEPTALNAFHAFAEKQQSLLSQVQTYEVKGEIKVTVSDSFVKAAGGLKEMKRTFSAWGKGDEIKEIVESLGEDGKVVGVDTYYLDAKRVTLTNNRVNATHRMAKIFTLGPHTGLFNDCPAFQEYSFLGVFLPPGGIPALRPSDLASKAKWATVATSVQAASMGDGLLHVGLAGSEGSSSIDFARPAELKGDYQISAVSFFTKDGTLTRKIEVLDFFRDGNLGRIGKAFRVSVYDPGTTPTLLVTWNLEIQEMKLNGPIEDALFTFDPASVDTIYDGDTKVTIRVPH